jgi:D-alanine-D-alanine ligase
MGGQSAEREVSLRSGETVLRELGDRHRVRGVEILAGGEWRFPPGAEALAPVAALERLLHDGVEVVFNALHGPLGEDGSVQGLFRVLQVPLTGPDVIPAAVTMDKRLTKLGLVAEGVPTPRFFALRPEELPTSAAAWEALAASESPRLPFPWVLKPNRLGSSVGVAFVTGADDLPRRAPEVLAQWPRECGPDDLLVEEVVRGREITCGVLETGGEPRALPPIEIRPRTSAFFDYAAKYTAGATEEICPAPLTPAQREAVEATAVRVHRLFRCAPLSRTDMFLTPAGEVQVLEVNTLPGLTATSLIPLAASRARLPLIELFERLLAHAVDRAAALGCRRPRPSGGAAVR